MTFQPAFPLPDGERALKGTGKRRVRLGVSLALASVLLMSCGGNPAGAPGQGAANLPPQTNPAVKDADKDKSAQEGPKRTIAGTVVDSLTGEPIDKVTLFVQGIETTVVTTPIPASPQGGGGGPTQLAQAMPEEDATGVPEAMESPDPFGPSPSPEASIEASIDPFASPTPMASGAVSPGPSPAAGAPTGQASTGPQAPVAAQTPYPLTPVKVDSKGKFELKDVPEGTYNLTFWAPGYEAETYQGNIPAEIEVKLRPLEMPTKNLHELKGVVRQANNEPAAGIAVEASSLRGQVPGVRQSSDEKGNFTLDHLLPGNYAVAAWTTDLEGEIDTFALVKEVPVAVGREKRSVSPTLVLHAVATPILLAGTVEGTIKEEDEAAAKKAGKPVLGVRPLSVRVFVRVDQGEIPLTTTTVGKDGYFRLRLPQLSEGVSYHLVAAGRSETGETVYLHRYGVTTSDPKLTLQLPDAPGAVTVDAPTTSPRFSWEAKSGDTSAYRVSVESLGDTAKTLWQGWTTGTAIRMPASKDFGLLKEGESYRVSLTAIKLGEDGKLDLTALDGQDWVTSGLAAPQTFEVQKLKPGQKAIAAPAKPTPAPGASAAPSSAPTPESKRIKTLDTL